jgi:hypothetical protein
MTKAFREMDLEQVQKLLEGHENVIAPAIEKEQTFMKSVPCPSCRAYETEARVNPKRPFTQFSILANKLLVCLACGTEFDPFLGIIYRPPTIASSG